MADMNREDAEEYTQSLGQIWAGSYRQVLWADQQGIPAVLGLTTREWVNQRLGGYVQMSIPERQEAVKELLAPVEEGGQGLSTREAAAVVGVSHNTVAKDVRPVTNVTPEPDPPEEDDDVVVTNVTPEPMNGFAFADPVKETDEEKAYYHLARVAVWAKLEADEVAAVCGDPETYLHTFEAFQSWMTRFVGALRARRAAPLRAVK